MTFDDFITKYNGQFLEVAGTPDAQNQCTDLANGYIRDVLGLPIIEWTNAKDFPSKAGSNYDWILNTPDGVPQKGDLVIWDERIGINGHIAIFIEGDTNRFTSFDENWPVGSPCKVVEHNWSCVSGWLHPIVQTSDALSSCLADRLKFWQERDQQIKINGELNSSIQKLQAEIDSKSKDIDNLKKMLDISTQSLGVSNNKLSAITAYIATCKWWVCSTNRIKTLLK
jgi:hypothetical protein